MPEPNAKLIAYSRNKYTGQTLATFLLRIHRFVLPQLSKHRVLSISAESSRAIPVYRQISRILEGDIAYPLDYGANQPGMQPSTQALVDIERSQSDWKRYAIQAVHNAAERACDDNPGWLPVLRLLADMGHSELLARYEAGYRGEQHKQAANRILEPYLYQYVVVSATEWDNFFVVRTHPDTQLELRSVALEMQDLLLNSYPATPLTGWHIPFLEESDLELPLKVQLKLGASRCAGLSYGIKPQWNTVKDLDRFYKLRDSVPRHTVPFEHVARATYLPLSSGNFRGGWKQLRHSHILEML